MAQNRRQSLLKFRIIAKVFARIKGGVKHDCQDKLKQI